MLGTVSGHVHARASVFECKNSQEMRAQDDACRYLHDHVEAPADPMARRPNADPYDAGMTGDAGGAMPVAAEQPGVVREVRSEALANVCLHEGNIHAGSELHVPGKVEPFDAF